MPAEPSYTRPSWLLAHCEVTRREGMQALRGARPGTAAVIWEESEEKPGLFRISFQEEPVDEPVAELLLAS